MTKEQAEMIGNWLANELLANESDIMAEFLSSVDGVVKVSAAITIRRISGEKHKIKCKFRVPRESIDSEVEFDMQMTLPGMG